MYRILVCFFLAVILLTGSSVFADDQGYYNNFKKIEGFGSIDVRLVGTAEEIGLNQKELRDFLRLRFKNTFAGIAFKDMENEWEYWVTSSQGEIGKLYRIGLIFVEVWTVGNDYPIAYHIQLHAGNYSNHTVYSDAFLGIGLKDTIQNKIKKHISELVDVFAINFFKARGEI